MGYKGCTCGSSGRWCRAEMKCCCCCGWCWDWTCMDKPLKRSIGTTGCNNTPSCAICSVVDHIFVVVFLPLINTDTFCRSKQDVIPCYLKQSTLNVSYLYRNNFINIPCSSYLHFLPWIVHSLKKKRRLWMWTYWFVTSLFCFNFSSINPLLFIVCLNVKQP